MALLSLGRIDADSRVNDATLKRYFKTVHGIAGFPIPDKLNDDDRNLEKEKRWVSPSRLATNEVADMTRFLQEVGLFPHANHDGFFGYVTQSAVRLFQEYVRVYDDGNKPGTVNYKYCYPDGIVGNDTRFHMRRWQGSGRTAHWGAAAGAKEDEQYQKWRNALLHTARSLQQNPSPMVAVRDRFTGKTDSLKRQEWEFPNDEPLLFGIRRNADRSQSGKRANDDLFVLLLNGRSFLFYGSTDPSQYLSRKDEPFLVEGQHLYQFSWHKVSNKTKTYRALRPATVGVVVVRDKTGANALTAANIERGPDPAPNPTINIHWSGMGHFNFSAGCQVIGGSSYVDSYGKVQTCRGYAAGSYGSLGRKVRGSRRRTKGAYNLLADLLLVYGRKPSSLADRPTLRYTLLADEDIAKHSDISVKDLRKLRKTFK